MMCEMAVPVLEGFKQTVRFFSRQVHEDRNGYLATILSALARLGFDPRQDASDLAAPSREAARVRLDALPATVKDAPTLGLGHRAVANVLWIRMPPDHFPE
tara:strand:- start:446 stop:748 length:303 start_codon:yes stop_codon:yes gene_type:complete